MSTQPRVAETLHRCPECGFTAAEEASFPLAQRVWTGRDIRECPDCGTKVTL